LELILKIDSKGRILIPAYIRRKLNFRNMVRVYVEEDRLIIRPIKNSVDRLTETVIKGSNNIEEEISRLRKIAEKEVFSRLG